VSTTTISSKFQIVIPKDIRDKLGLKPRQRFHVLEKGRTIILVPEVPLSSLRGIAKGMNTTGIREKKERM
jgi:AbrB family looped-hinge helix DNA binding protein